MHKHIRHKIKTLVSRIEKKALILGGMVFLLVIGAIIGSYGVLHTKTVKAEDIQTYPDGGPEVTHTPIPWELAKYTPTIPEDPPLVPSATPTPTTAVQQAPVQNSQPAQTNTTNSGGNCHTECKQVCN